MDNSQRSTSQNKVQASNSDSNLDSAVPDVLTIIGVVVIIAILVFVIWIFSIVSVIGGSGRYKGYRAVFKDKQSESISGESNKKTKPSKQK